MSKICIECGSYDYHARGLCKKCYSKEYRLKHKDDIKKYYQEHREQILEYLKEYRVKIRKKGGGQSMAENRECPLFLGCHIAERVLSHVFDDVIRQPVNNPGFDFICNHGKKIDVKSSCLHIRKNEMPSWCFNIKNNKTADYFLCLAFDDRETLTPIYMWLIPSHDVNEKQNICVNIDTYIKWDKYALDINKVSNCCDILKGEY